VIRMSSPATRLLAASVTAAVAMALSACSGASQTSSAAPTSSAGAATPSATSSAPPILGPAAPTIAIAGDFCDLSVAGLAALATMSAATDDLDSAMSDPAAIGGTDLSALRTAGQAIVDNSAPSATFLAEGSRVAGDQATKDAFTGLSRYVSAYENPLAHAGLDSQSYGEFVTRVLAVINDSSLTALADGAAAWTETTRAFAAAKCGAATQG